MTTPITMDAYIKAAQEVIDSYPPDIRQALFMFPEIEVRISKWGDRNILDSTGQFWSVVTPFLAEFKGFPIHRQSVSPFVYPDAQNPEAFNNCFPTLENWKDALRFAIKQVISGRLR